MEVKHAVTTLWRDLEMEPSTIIGQEMAKADADTTFKLSSENLAKLQGLRQEVGFTFPFIVQYVCLLNHLLDITGYLQIPF